MRLTRGQIDIILNERLRPYGDAPWWEAPNLWEPSVRLALTDLCRFGDVVFDVGGNFGGLSAIFSRLVGPNGRVCTFEASPRIFPHLQQNIIRQGFTNVTAYHSAVYFRSGDQVKIYAGDHLNDSIYTQGRTNAAEIAHVETVSLDDFVAFSGLVPRIIKIDIEGGEFDALLGSAALIERHRPHIVLEQQTDDSRCLDHLLQLGYSAIDLNSYRLVTGVQDYPPGVGLRNVLFVHSSRTSELPYKLPVTQTVVKELTAGDFKVAGTGYIGRGLRLPAGRYACDMKFSAEGTANEMICGARIAGTVRFRYHAYSKLLADSYRDWVFDVPLESDVELFFEFLRDTSDPTFRLTGGTLTHLSDVQVHPHVGILLR